ncbi:hypothetical protein V1460_02810 [Streptomyces sp. SCSIO 30461]|uniref:hypothetical protein n=1 Tax=Streptomyces sp. SCSIO 30461 TaxID=3118085 RepID=UPI0030CCD824
MPASSVPLAPAGEVIALLRMASRRVVQPINGPELAGHAGRFDRLGHSRRLTGYFRVMR